MTLRSIVNSLLFCSASLVAAQTPGDNDPTFNPADAGFANGYGFDINPSKAVAQSDGRTIVCGTFTQYNGVDCHRLLRFNTDGTLDNTFAIGSATAGGSVFALALQADGKILIGGQFAVFNGVPRNRIVRLNPDGSVDDTYAEPTVVFGTAVRDIAVQPDGAILVCADSRQCRFLSNGTLDNTFTASTQTGHTVVRTQADGKVLQAGSFTGGISRKTATGAVDATFTIGTGFVGAVNHLELQPDGKILAVGAFTSFNGNGCNRIARLNANGTFDATFVIGSGFNAAANTVLTTPQGIHIGGLFTAYNGSPRRALVRLATDGSLHPFDAAISGFNNQPAITAMALRPDGKLALFGTLADFQGTCRTSAATMNGDGTLDHSAFANLGTGVNRLVRSIVKQADGKLMIGGDFTAYNGTTAIRLVRTSADGSADPTFNIGSGFNNIVYATAVQPDGSVLVGGQFSSVNGIPRNGIVRLLADGAVDLSFDPGAQLAPAPSQLTQVRSILVRADGTILLGGWFTWTPNGHGSVVRLLPTGQLDTSFDPGSGINGTVWCMVERPDGRLVCAGNFTQCAGVNRGSIAQLNTNGSLDNGFAPSTGFTGITPWVRGLALQPDGKLVAAGWFITFNGANRQAWVRMNTDGSADNSFTSGSSPFLIESLLATAHGKFFVGGQPSSTAFKGVRRLNADGSTDTVFDVPIGLNYPVGATGTYALAAAGQDKIMVGGPFRSYDGIGRNGLARVWTAPPQAILVALRAFLDGCYHPDVTLCSDVLRMNGLIPLNEPYTALNMFLSVGGSESTTQATLDVTGPDAIVDWVLVELRTATDPVQVISTRSALLQRDGDVVDVDGASAVAFNEVAGNYHVAIRHRNHLGAMTASPAALSTIATTIDLTESVTATYGVGARKQVGPTMTLWSGDATGDGILRYTGSANDRDPILLAVGSTTPNATLTNVYDRRDTNLDGVIKYTGSANDRDIILNNVGSTTPNSTRTQQLP